jgi:hypothetical protein
MLYNPQPIQTGDIILPQELADIIEEISMNIHEVWAQGRIREGWRYGEKIDPELKTHPSLVPYGQLSESEKDYDRNTVTQTIKCLLKKGYHITR